MFLLSLCFVMSGCARLMNIGQMPHMTAGLAQPTNVPRPDMGHLQLQRPDPYSRYKQNFPHMGQQRRMPPMGQTQGQMADQMPLNPHVQSGIHSPQKPANYASLWHSGPESLFGDRRARNIGDILTVNIEINDSAQVDNRTERARDSTDESKVSAGFGIDNLINKNLPSPLSLTPGLNATGNQTTTGQGKINRSERIELKVAAVVVDILRNGNLIIQGSQEVNVNYELRDLQISGVVRPHDISRRNTISYDKIAEARIYYGGRGNVSELQQPRYGSQIFDVIAPF